MLYLNHEKKGYTPEIHKALRIADGYLFLGLFDESLAALDVLTGEETKVPEVMLARNRVLLHKKEWGEVERTAYNGLRAYPERDEFIVQRALALRKLKKGNVAMDVILSAPDWIRQTGILHYNLACYEAQLGDIKIARQCIDVAIHMNEAMRMSARKDPDLRELYN
jgi:hypothetical protein